MAKVTFLPAKRVPAARVPATHQSGALARSCAIQNSSSARETGSPAVAACAAAAAGLRKQLTAGGASSSGRMGSGSRRRQQQGNHGQQRQAVQAAALHGQVTAGDASSDGCTGSGGRQRWRQRFMGGVGIGVGSSVASAANSRRCQQQWMRGQRQQVASAAAVTWSANGRRRLTQACIGASAHRKP
eukprot:357031-Chlamydomonas_euryale.AAC.4